MPAPRKFDDDTRRNILDEFLTDTPAHDIAAKYGCDYSRTIRKLWLTVYTKEQLHERFRRLCAISKLGELNPMYDKKGELHPRRTEKTYGARGYVYVETPDWWEGCTKGRKVAEHILIVCKELGLTSLPLGYVVHHVDEDKANNHPDNLELLTRVEHMSKHKNAKRKVSREGATTIPKGSRELEGSRSALSP